jgi:hypothetical protein
LFVHHKPKWRLHQGEAQGRQAAMLDKHGCLTLRRPRKVSL